MREGYGLDILEEEMNERQSRLKQAKRKEKKKEQAKHGVGPTPDGESKDLSTTPKKKLKRRKGEKPAPEQEWDDSKHFTTKGEEEQGGDPERERDK
ncbi:hypothetical protein BDM02DRAFT_3188212 [Thelephora ganbajun]|uniref:Uncharacterized protein n=1 Tax=Thelephora ganbajun TaxID=370292 RepID=A0ACB6ZC68_THEGA|nr:hypothetical protein BDM02DRAFT_3188212 [Thelephora ganbajun]